MTAYADDSALFELLKTQLYTAVVGDVLDTLGLQHQFLPPAITALERNMKLAGRAMPVLEADIYDAGRDDAAGPLANKPFGLMLEALDDLRPGEVYVATGGSPRYAQWGELMSTRATHLQAAGAVLDGYARDAEGIAALGFATFCRGVYAQDQSPRGQVIDFRCVVEIAGIRIEPGTLIFGDREGVLVIPKHVEREAVELALEKATTENKVEQAIKDGMSAVGAFA
ncbi:MAG: RraA family protein, partial [Gammaproteobacteria bacterium]|nr:RraA family protein [Gammaproteobacteria bacterium]